MATPKWMKDLKPSDWFFDGHPIRGEVALARFAALKWSKAWLDMGPSISGNLGPYWHVPLGKVVINGNLYDMGDTTHRLYPKLLQTKWFGLLRHACEEVRAKCDSAKLQAENNDLRVQLIVANSKLAELQRKAKQ